MEKRNEENSINNSNTTLIRYFLWLLFYLSCFKQLSVLKLTLDQMSTTGKSFPLQTALGYVQFFWDFVDSIWSLMLGKTISYHLFENYMWGGFTYMAFIWSVIQFIDNRSKMNYPNSPILAKSRKLMLFCIIFFIGTIIYGLDRDQWVPYVQEPSWVINLAHKQQVSAGTFLIVYYTIFIASYFPSSRFHEGAINFHNRPKLIIYVFLCMNLDNFASFNWFPGPIDPNNSWLKGYEEIFQEGQTWTSSDKIYHFTMSSVAVIILIMYTPNKNKAIIGAVTAVIFWELFEISLNPREASDSLLDMVINTSAIILAAQLIETQSEESTMEK